MKNTLFSRCCRVLICACLLVSIAVSLLGCGGGASGETAAEVHRRHIDVVRTNNLQMQDDLDALFLLDRPSRLSSRYVR